MKFRNGLQKLKRAFIIFALVWEITVFQLLGFSVAALDTTGEEEMYSERDFCVVVDYYSEKIRIIHPNSLLGRYSAYDFVEIADNDSVINNFASISSIIGKSDLAANISIAKDGEYMYALKVVSDDILDSYTASGKNSKRISTLMKEKWYPIYGGGFDIKSAIPLKMPRDSRKKYYIAIRKADDVFDTETGYASRVTVCIKPRYNEKNFSKFIEYDAFKEKIVLSSGYIEDSFLNIIYKYEFFEPLSGKLTKDSTEQNANINVSGRIFSLGGYVYISTLPFTKEGPDGIEVTFARSKELKFKIPAVPNVPAIKVDLSGGKIISINKNAVEWSLTGSDNPDSWYSYERAETTLAFSDVLSAFSGLNANNIDEDGNYAIYFRTKAVEKRTPASPAKKILVPSENVGKYEN